MVSFGPVVARAFSASVVGGLLLLLPSTLSSSMVVESSVSIAFQAPEASPSDEVIRGQIESILAEAPDMPGENITVEVEDGVVTLTSLGLCEGHGCPGTTTPAGIWTLDQHIGAIVRLVPGVTDVRLELGLDPTPNMVDSTEVN